MATLSSKEHRGLATHARDWAERLLDDAGRLDAHPGLDHELVGGWLRRVHDGDPASAA